MNWLEKHSIGLRKKLLLLCILVFSIGNGFLRYHYIINFYDLNDVIAKRTTLKYLYPKTFSELFISLFEDPRWLSNIYFMVVAIGSTVATIYLLFGKKMAFVSFLCYMILLLFCLLFICVSLVTGNYKAGFGIAQEIKNLAQSPIVSFIIVALFYFSSMDFKSASE